MVNMESKFVLLLAVGCLAAIGNGDPEPGQRDQRQLFSASGLVFPGPPGQPNQRRRTNSEPQISSKSDLTDDSPFLPVNPNRQQQPRPQQQAPSFRPQQQNRQSYPNPAQNYRPNPSSFPQQRQPVEVPVYRQPQERPVNPRPLPNFESRQDTVKPERVAPSAPVSLGQPNLPEAAQRGPNRERPRPIEIDEEEDRIIESAEEEQFAPVRPQRPQQPQQPKQPQQPQQPKQPQQPQQPRQPQPPRPAPEARRPSVESESRRPQPNVQAKRPNYPANYRPSGAQVNELEEKRPAQANEEAEEPEEVEEEEEVKPDKLQLLLQKTDFNCAEKKDGYYADEAVDCQVFHYCQDRTRHSWLCPEGASFHQVHLICMPITKENICHKSSEFHFVNDYLYKPLEDDNGDSSLLYADRYYPEGYEPGLPFDMEKVSKPENPQYKSYLKSQANKERQQAGRPSGDNRRQDSRVPVQRRPVEVEDERPQIVRRPEANLRPARPIPARPVEEEESEEEDY